MPVEKEVLIQGVGIAQFRDLQGNRICNFLNNDSLQITHNQNFEMVRAGDSVYATMSFLTESDGNVQINTVLWDWENAKMIAGLSNVQTDQADTLEVIAEKHTVVNNTFTLKYGSTLEAESDRLYYVEDGISLTRVTAGNEAEGSYSIDASGVCTFDPADEGKEIYCDYTRSVTGIVVVDMKKLNLPPYGQLIHTGRVVGKDESTFQTVQTHIYKCRFNGQLSLNFQRAQATSPQLQLEIFDPNRSDGKIFDMKFAE